MADFEEHFADVKKYDPDADEAVVKKLFHRIRIVLENRDSATVACSDMSELETARNGYCKKTLGLDATLDDDKIMGILLKVCDQMKGDNSKSRLTYYYLVAKHTDTLDKF